MIFHLLSAKGAERPSREKFLQGRIQVISRSGLNPCEAALIQSLEKWHAAAESKSAAISPAPNPSHGLTIGNRTGVLGQAACEVFRASATLHSFDIHHFRTMESNILAGMRNRAIRVCAADLPPDETYDWVLFQLNRGNLSTELVSDLLQQVMLRLRPKGRVLFAIEGAHAWLVKRLKHFFRNVQISTANRSVTLVEANGLKDEIKEKSFAAHLQVTLPDGIAYPIVTYPGVFAHRRADEGGLSLTESADVQAGDRILDMGCGSGMIGLGLAKMAKLERLTLVDSHARAIKAAHENVRTHQAESFTDVLHSDGAASDFESLLGQYTLFVGNPPYYSQNQVTQRFVELSFQVLAPCGRACFVTKNPEWLGQEIERYFGEVQFFSRRHYTILRSVKP